VNYATVLRPYAVAVGDFNGDGKTDLAVANTGNSGVSGGVSVLLGSGDGTFQAAVNYGVEVGMGSVAVGDINGDGKADLAVARSAGGAVLLGNGDGTFQSAVNCATLANPHSDALGDFNGDGKVDTAVASAIQTLLYSYNNSISILYGNGNGTFVID
jgi:FG-GAP-like repeat